MSGCPPTPQAPLCGAIQAHGRGFGKMGLNDPSLPAYLFPPPHLWSAAFLQTSSAVAQPVIGPCRESFTPLVGVCLDHLTDVVRSSASVRAP